MFVFHGYFNLPDLFRKVVNAILAYSPAHDQIFLGCQQWGDMVYPHPLDFFVGQMASTITTDNPLETVNQGGAQPHKMTSFAKQILHGAQLLGINVLSFRKNTQTKKMGQPESIMLITAVF